jgi:nicotinamide-nucleotide amidase
MTTAIVVSIGDELLDGRVQDLNASFLATQLQRLGIQVVHLRTIGDRPDELKKLLADVAATADLIVSSGGLGPTADDRVRAETADELGVPLAEIPGALKELERIYRRVRPDQEPPSFFQDQGRIPGGGVPLSNPAGTAWGFQVQLPEGSHYIALPGPPRECKAVWQSALGPLHQALGEVPELAYGLFHTASVPESGVEEKVRDLLRQGGNPRMGITAKGKQVTLSVLARADDPAHGNRSAHQVVADMAETLEQRLNPWLWGRDQQTLEGVVVEELQKRGQTLAVAESCTGGRLAGALTGVSGASAVLHFGWVCYANEAKAQELGVPLEWTEEGGPGAVSGEVALAMAKGARQQAGADWGIGITGVAGPGGGTETKPVGTVWLGLAGPDVEFAVLRHQWTRGGRPGVQQGSVRDALEILRRTLLGLPPLPEQRP